MLTGSSNTCIGSAKLLRRVVHIVTFRRAASRSLPERPFVSVPFCGREAKLPLPVAVPGAFAPLAGAAPALAAAVLPAACFAALAAAAALPAVLPPGALPLGLATGFSLPLFVPADAVCSAAASCCTGAESWPLQPAQASSMQSANAAHELCRRTCCPITPAGVAQQACDLCRLDASSYQSHRLDDFV